MSRRRPHTSRRLIFFRPADATSPRVRRSSCHVVFCLGSSSYVRGRTRLRVDGVEPRRAGTALSRGWVQPRRAGGGFLCAGTILPFFMKGYGTISAVGVFRGVVPKKK